MIRTDNDLFAQPTYLDALTDELALAGRPAPEDLDRLGRDAIHALELALRAVLTQYLNPNRTQAERHAITAALSAAAVYAGTRFGPGDAVTLDAWFPGEPDRPEGRVTEVNGHTATVAWECGRIEQLDAGELHHDHCQRWQSAQR